MNRQKHDCEDRDDQQRVLFLVCPYIFEPCQQLMHTPWRVERRRRLEHDADHLAIGIECSNVISECLVFAAMTLVLLAVAQKIAMLLLEVALCKGNVGP